MLYDSQMGSRFYYDIICKAVTPQIRNKLRVSDTTNHCAPQRCVLEGLIDPANWVLRALILTFACLL